MMMTLALKIDQPIVEMVLPYGYGPKGKEGILTKIALRAVFNVSTGKN